MSVINWLEIVFEKFEAFAISLTYDDLVVFVTRQSHSVITLCANLCRIKFSNSCTSTRIND